MSKKSIYITVLFLSLYIFSFSQLTIVGTEVTLSGDVLLYSDNDVINVDSSAEIKVLGNSQLICSDSLKNNGVINSAFMLLFRDLIRLFACYNDGIINLLGKSFLLN